MVARGLDGKPGTWIVVESIGSTQRVAMGACGGELVRRRRVHVAYSSRPRLARGGMFNV